jgi:ribosome-binding factor A
MDAARTRRLAERISKIVAELLERRIKDPRLGFVTVTEVRLTADWREAKVFYTVLGTPEEQADTAVALASATGIIRSEVGRIIGLRHAPSIEFVADVLPDSARRIDDAIAAARAADEELAQAREGAEWAGDPDPYKKPAEDDEDDWDEGEDGDLADGEEIGDGERT